MLLAVLPFRDGTGHDSDEDVSVLEREGILLSPSAEETFYYEDVWSLVERAVSTHNLPQEIEEDLRLINKMIIDCRQMATDPGDDLYENLCRKLDLLLPSVLSVLNPGQQLPALKALRSAANGAPEEEQLHAINEGFSIAAAMLRGVAEDLPKQSLPPYAPNITARVERSTERLKQTIPAFENWFEQAGRFLQLPVSRAAIAGGQWVAATAVGTNLQIALADGDIPQLPQGGLRIATSALLSGLILKWIYSRRRKGADHLPGIPQPPRDRAPTNEKHPNGTDATC